MQIPFCEVYKEVMRFCRLHFDEIVQHELDLGNPILEFIN